MMPQNTPNAAERAIEYRKRGWFPIPIPTRSKIPPANEWQLLRLAVTDIPKYFAGLINIGILTGSVSKNLIDIDLDTQSAIRVAPNFLPVTVTFGRPSKPVSHWIYTSYGARTEIFTTPKKINNESTKVTTLVELRADGKQTVFPNSIHESGELITWGVDIDQAAPTEIKANDLRTAVAKIAVAALLIEFGWTDADAVSFVAQPNMTALAQLAPEVRTLAGRWLNITPTPPPKPARPAGPKLDDSFEIAVARWNAQHPITFQKRNTNPCPVCDDQRSYGQLLNNPDMWSCFSTDHPDDVGRRSPKEDCFIGDALDLEAFARKKTRAQVLREDGYLQPLLKVVPPQPVSSQPEPELLQPPDRPPSYNGEDDPPEDNRPNINLTPEMHEVVDQTVSALVVAEELFQRGSHLVHVTTAVRSPMHTKLFGPTPSIEPISDANLVEFITKNAKIYKYDARGPKWVHTIPPSNLIRGIIDRGKWRGIRPLEGIVEVPTVRLDGSILDTPGYDEETGLIFRPAIAFDAVKTSPTLEDAKIAIAELLDLVCDFPFAAPSALYRSAWLAAVLTPFIRTAIPTAPMFLVDSNIRGSGKSKLCDIVSMIATGRPMPRTVNPPHDEEFKKLVTSLAIAGSTLVMIDNITGSLGSQALDAVLTAATWKDRILGKSEMTREIPLTTIWFATGNNVELEGDLCRRTIHIRLKTNDESPETRQNFKHKSLLEHVLKNRNRLVACALTVLRGYVAAGSPPQRMRAIDFREWSAVVRGALIWAGLEDPGETQIELAQSDTDKVGLSLLLDALDRFPEGGIGLSTANILRLVTMGGEDSDLLREAVSELCPTRDGKPPSAFSLGKRLGALRARVVNGRCIDNGSETSDRASWRVVRINSKLNNK